MGKLFYLDRLSIANTLILATIIGCVLQDVIATVAPADQQASSSTRVETHTCETEDLNHSILVECNVTSCARPTISSIREEHGAGGEKIDWPLESSQIIHVYSTLAGERFAQVSLPNLDYEEDYRARLLDINTTLYVKMVNTLDWDGVERHNLAGFGATLDFMKLERALNEGQFERLFGLIFDDLFRGISSGANLTVLRLYINLGQNQKERNLQATLLKLDDQLGKRASRLPAKLKLMIDLYNYAESSDLELSSNFTRSLVNTQLWAVSIDTGFKNSAKSRVSEPILPPDTLLFASTEPLLAPYIVDELNRKPASKFQGILIRSKSSVPYNYLQYSRKHARSNIRLMTVGRASPKTKNLGDWQNAQESASELMNHLKYGSNGYIDHESVLDVLADQPDDGQSSDCSLYSLHQDHGLHFRGPKFYALGHFSRYLKEGSLPLETELFTQPNMFAAQYSAFMSADRQYVVGVVLNDNEHLLPFRLAIDKQIRVFANLEPKSFNTFLIKLGN
uniref:Uncharacterized protein n=1 Tax=Aceria tosichella TaxID=561515 RepID=A0A6G1SPL0_9ACAR